MSSTIKCARRLGWLGGTLALLCAAACDGGRTPTPIEPPSAKLPKIARFVSDRGAVRAGETVELSWKVTDADTVEITPDTLTAQPVLEGMVTTPPITVATTFILRARSAAGVDQRSVSITVPADAMAPVINSFSASPAIVAMGAESVLSWEVDRATSIRLEMKGGGVLVADAMARGTFAVQPMQSTRYVLIAEGRGLTVEREAEIIVGKAPMITEFIAAPEEIRVGETAQLSWTAEDATQIRILDGANVVFDTMEGQGSTPVSPRATTEYVIEASNNVGNTTSRVSVRVVGANPPVIDEFSVTPLSLLGPGTVTVRWSATDADSVGLFAGGNAVAGFPGGAMGMFDLPVTADTNVELRAMNGFGMDTEQAMVTVMALPDGTPPLLTHTPISTTQTAGLPIPVEATATDSESGVLDVTLYYRPTGTGSYTSLVLAAAGSTYSGDIPGAVVTMPGVDYYLEARDNAGTPNRAVFPAGAPATVLLIPVIAPDNTPPVITHTPIANGQLAGAPVTVSATILDAGSGVGAANLYYRRQGMGAFLSRTMMAMSGDRFTADIPANVITAGTVEYYIEAVDGASPANASTAPTGAPAVFSSFSVTVVDGVAPVIQHTPVPQGQTANGAVQVAAQVTDASGVASVTLRYRTQGMPTFQTAAMTGSGGNYAATIPAGTVQTPGVDYYIEAVDSANPSNTGRSPAAAPGTTHAFTVAMADTNPPQITHTQVTSPRAPGASVNVNATITDASTIVSATLFYRRIGGSSFTSLPMTGGPSYVAVIPASDVEPPGIEYYIRAADGAAAMNAGTSPAAAPGAVFSFGIGVSENEPNATSAQATALVTGGRLGNQGLGSITPTGDRDYWAIDLPVGPLRYSIRAETTSGGPGICPSPVATVLRLYGADGTTQIATDTFDGVGSCSLIDPAVDAGARALAAGRYYLRVEESGENASIAGYELTVTLVPTACGNGILELPANEQCDDNNTSGGDGCSATCTIEPEGVLMAPGGTLSGDISPTGDEDTYAIDLVGTTYVRAEATDATGTACPGDLVIDLVGLNGTTVIGTDDDDGIGLCPLINPLVDVFARSLPAGRYYLRVRASGGTATILGYRLRVNLTATLCGNGTREGTEQCDDSNATLGDGCSDTCQFETVATAMGTGGTFSDSIALRNIDYYAVAITAGQSIRAETFVPSAGTCTIGNDTVIRLWSPGRTTEIVSDDEGGINSCSLLDPANDIEVRNLATGTYYVSVEEYQNNATITAYAIDIQIRQPGCGNGWVDGADQCDDGGTMAGDGCSSTCQFEGPAEVEPNNTSATATVLRGAADPNDRTLLGSIASGTDIDFFSIVVPAQASVFAEVSDGMGGCPNNGSLRLVGVDGTTSLVLDTADGPGNCGQISPTRDVAARFMAAGTYYLRVESTGGSAAYQLQVRVTPPSCGDAFLTTGEACDDSNTMNGDGCSSMCAIEGTAEMEPNNTQATATVLLPAGTSSAASIRGVLATISDIDAFSVVVPAGSHIIAEVSDGRGRCPNGASLRLRSPGGTSLTTDATDGPDGCGRIAAGLDTAARGLSAGTYAVEVYTTGTSVPPAVYQLDVRVVPANVCGNLYIDGTEQCDDGNVASGDGCSSSCTWELTETEPNGTFMSATPLNGNIRLGRGAITASDVDWYSIVVPAGSVLTIRTQGGARDQCPAGADTLLSLFGPDGITEIANDDDDSAGTCSVIEASEANGLAAGTYYLRVDPYMASTFPLYGISVTIHPN